MRLYQELPKIIILSRQQWYDCNRPPLRVQLALAWSTVLTFIVLLLSVAITGLVDGLAQALASAGQPVAVIRLAEPASRVIVAALIIEVAYRLAGVISPAYVAGGRML